MLFADCEDMKTLWFLYMYSWGGTVVAGLDAASLCTTPTPPPSSAAWPLGAAAPAAAPHSRSQGRGSSHAPRATASFLFGIFKRVMQHFSFGGVFFGVGGSDLRLRCVLPSRSAHAAPPH